ncbi:unnamed protein product, partial [Effrenium voratum]
SFWLGGTWLRATMALEAALQPTRDWREFRAWMSVQPPTPRRVAKIGDNAPLSYRSTLALAGLSISDGDDVKPASNSLHESALYKQSMALSLPALDETRVKWERDRVCQASKYGGMQPSTEKARFTVDLPEGPQNRKYCYEVKEDLHKSVLASQIAKEAEEAKEEQRVQTRRNSLMKIKEGTSFIANQEPEDPSRKHRLVERLISKNKFQEESLENIWEEIEQSREIAPEGSVICARAVALKMMKKVVVASGCPASLEAPIFNFMRSKLKEYAKGKPVETMDQAGFLDFCQFSGLLLEYETEEAPAKRASVVIRPEEL